MGHMQQNIFSNTRAAIRLKLDLTSDLHQSRASGVSHGRSKTNVEMRRKFKIK